MNRLPRAATWMLRTTGDGSRGIFGMFGKKAGKPVAATAPLDPKTLLASVKDLPPMREHPNPAIKHLGEQYAQAQRKCSLSQSCTNVKEFSCPGSGFPSHCCKECYDEDKKFQSVVQDLKMVYEDTVDLRSGRKFPEFEFPGPPANDFMMTDLSQWRMYMMERQFKSCLGIRVGDARTEEERELEARSMRHITSMFTFPLTIAHAAYWHQALGDSAKFDKKDEDGNLIPKRLCVIGARAEATLPDRIWLELNAIFPDAAFDIHLVGPHVPEEKHEQVKELNNGRLTLTWTRGLYQEVHEYHDIPDLYVIFNSGVGHGVDEAHWKEALDLMFNKSGFKPCLFTSHNKEDTARDYSYLSRRQDCRFITHPKENPFMSLKKDVALNNLHYVINSNHSYALVKGSPPDGLIWGGSLLEKIRSAASSA